MATIVRVTGLHERFLKGKNLICAVASSPILTRWTIGGGNTTSGLDDLEKLIMAEMRKIYSEKAIDHALNPRNAGRIEEADGFAKITGPCGDTIEISLRVTEEKVVDAKFWTNGCGTSIACGSMATELVKGKKVVEALRIDSEYILNALGGLPESDIHCAILASNSLREAIKDHLVSKTGKKGRV